MLSLGYTTAGWFLLSEVVFLGIFGSHEDGQIYEKLVYVVVNEILRASPVSRDVRKWRKVVEE